jgi:hypothetical protein
MEENGCKPSLGHSTVTIPLDVSLAVPDGRKHALDGIRTSQGLSYSERHWKVVIARSDDEAIP